MEKSTENQEIVSPLPNLPVMPPAPLKPEDLSAFAISDALEDCVTKKMITIVPVRKPSKEAFVRTHPDPKNWNNFSLIELKEQGTTYLLSRDVAGELREASEPTLITATLALAVDRKGNPFFWLLRVSDKENTWTSSARRAAELAKDQWIRLTSNTTAGYYDTSVAKVQASEPIWPDMPYYDLLHIAFDGRIISSMDHPVLKELRGE